ncbi:MAG: terpene cyclase/mutase family protein [Gemmataceae bacterium]|nr:terpene cyclase/mutase family protein [Gemmataceae bacterium]
MRLVGLTSWFLATFFVFAGNTRGEEIPEPVQRAIERGLEYLDRTQHRDGRWDANGGQYPASMTALGGMVMLMEGSTLREGRYSQNIRRAVDWFMDRVQPNGLLGNPNNPTESGRYMYGHGFGLLFLACAFGEEEDLERRKRLEKILTKAVEFCGKAQTDKGGWGYVSAADGNNFDEGSVTITQLQALRAAKNAGIVVPKSIIDKAVDYLKNSTTERGGVIYSLAHGGVAVNGGERPPLTAAAIACAFSAGQYDSPLAKKWLKFCRDHIGIDGRRQGHDEYLQYYYAQAMYILGEDRWAKLFPEEKDTTNHMTWSKYRKQMHDHILKTQTSDGSWTGGYIGPHFATCVNLTILQLDNGTLPIYSR